MRWRVRPGEPTDLPDVMRVLEGALLEVDIERIRTLLAETVAQDGVLVATIDGRTVGAIVVADAEILAIAVRRRHRRRGIGRSLVGAAADRWGPLTAHFDADLRSFYRSLGFRIVRCGGRFRGRFP